ncbi:lactonase family protein ['Paenibacillus yunnanensis' Narsing Rao et al. 2020]|uniref:lactonase family protein n=1 Tax=Paenibacillus tengchongensis TaxID=2608684 RepID=UPI00124CCABC|nr:lactonase family protein [Paenibacillus tengchongensis]
MNHQKQLLFVGSYAAASDNGVQVYEFDGAAGGTLTLKDSVTGIINPTFLHVDIPGRKLHAIGERLNEAGGKEAEVVTYAIDPATGTLNELKRTAAMPATEDRKQTTACHINQDSGNEYMIVCSYHGGMAGLFAMDEDGLPARLTDTAVHTGEAKPHLHSAIFSPDGRFVFLSDLGLDLIRTYKIDKDRQRLEAVRDTTLHQGAGPRHFLFHPDGRKAYVINELDSTVTSFRYDSETGELKTLATVSTLPEGYSGDNSCAEIAISEDGRFLYGSNRGHDSIVVYAVGPEAEELTPVEYVATRGGHPRHFALLPGGDFLVAANRDGNNLVVFSVDRESGRLTFTGNTAETGKPVCVKPVIF